MVHRYLTSVVRHYDKAIVDGNVVATDDYPLFVTVDFRMTKCPHRLKFHLQLFLFLFRGFIWVALSPWTFFRVCMVLACLLNCCSSHKGHTHSKEHPTHINDTTNWGASKRKEDLNSWKIHCNEARCSKECGNDRFIAKTWIKSQKLQIGKKTSIVQYKAVFNSWSHPDARWVWR